MGRLGLSDSEVVLGSYHVWVNVSWEKKIPVHTADKIIGLRNFKCKKGFPAWMLISESRLFLLSEFNTQTKFMYILPLSGKKRQSFYMELALEKLFRYSFGANNFIEFEPHGQVGKTKIDFKSISNIQKQRIQENIEKAKILNKNAPGVGIIITGRSVEKVFNERTGLASVRETIQALEDFMQLDQWIQPTPPKPYRSMAYERAVHSPEYDFCPNCGNTFSEKYKFCPVCGTKLL